MSASRTILLGTALGLAVGAAALAQDTPPATTDLGSDVVTGDQTGNTLEVPLPGSMSLDLDSTAQATIETPLPQGDELIAAADELIGARVYDANQEWVGELSELLPATGTDERRVVIDIGGFLGFGETPVEVAAEHITIAWTEAGEIDHAMVALTEAELETMANTQG